jgi:hypothetical protein
MDRGEKEKWELKDGWTYRYSAHGRLGVGMLFGQGHREQTQCLCQDGAKSPEERQQNAEEAHRARGAPSGALPEKTGTCRRLTNRK